MGHVKVLLILELNIHSAPTELNVQSSVGAVPRAGWERGPLLVHLVVTGSLVGVTIRIRARRDTCGRLGSMLLVHRTRSSSRAPLLSAGRATRSTPRARPWVWCSDRWYCRRQMGHHAYVCRVRTTVHCRAGCLCVYQLPRWCGVWRRGRSGCC